MDIKEIMFTEDAIRNRVRELGQVITKDLASKELRVIGVLKGAIIFMSDLVRAIDLPMSLDFIAVSSYGEGTSSSGAVRILKDLERSIEGKHVLLVEDIVDTGLTLKYLTRNLQARGPAEIYTCTLLDKPDRRLVEVELDYCGFVIPDWFVVGYGLDYAEAYRQLPYIAVLKEPK